MRTVAGVFSSRGAAREAAFELMRSGFLRDEINLLLPDGAQEEIHSVPVSQAEQPGVGGALGGVLGAALGAAGGFELGVGATALIPGVGPVLAAGIAGAALLGAGGLVAGAEVGTIVDEKTTEGIPSDEVFFYEDALRQGRSLLILLVDSEEKAERARDALAHAGAQSIDAARQAWWIGLRDAEAVHYHALGHNFERDQEIYRAGFESALRRECQGKTVDMSADCLKWWHPDTWDSEPFRRGFERGMEYLAGAHPPE